MASPSFNPSLYLSLSLSLLHASLLFHPLVPPSLPPSLCLVLSRSLPLPSLSFHLSIFRQLLISVVRTSVSPYSPSLLLSISHSNSLLSLSLSLFLSPLSISFSPLCCLSVSLCLYVCLYLYLCLSFLLLLSLSPPLYSPIHFRSVRRISTDIKLPPSPPPMQPLTMSIQNK